MFCLETWKRFYRFKMIKNRMCYMKNLWIWDENLCLVLWVYNWYKLLNIFLDRAVVMPCCKRRKSGYVHTFSQRSALVKHAYIIRDIEVLDVLKVQGMKRHNALKCFLRKWRLHVPLRDLKRFFLKNEKVQKKGSVIVNYFWFRMKKVFSHIQSIHLIQN